MSQPTASFKAIPVHPAAAQVLDFWLADGLAQGWPTQAMGQRWFGSDIKLDQEIEILFGACVRQALRGELKDWEQAPLDRLALVILLDQFPRNIFRGTGQAFAGDARAQRLVQDTLAHQFDLSLPWVGRVFTYMPLMHAEDLALQNQCVACFSTMVNEAPAAMQPHLQSSLAYARQHRDIIAHFGRFPYRNAALERVSTGEEEKFLTEGPRFGQ